LRGDVARFQIGHGVAFVENAFRDNPSVTAGQTKANQVRIGFLCRLSATDLVRLRSRLYDIIILEEDQVLFVPMCAKWVNQIEAAGRPTEAVDAKDVVIVA